ncbi:MAG: hypothetical protein RLZZ437_2808 [Pseudomonadota bacterium]
MSEFFLLKRAPAKQSRCFLMRSPLLQNLQARNLAVLLKPAYVLGCQMAAASLLSRYVGI